MSKKYYFINDCPLYAVTLSGTWDENFHPGQEIILVNRKTRRCCPKFIERVVDAGDGKCVLDLYYA
ncbi:hypothetical protein AB6735_03695 [Mucilaginibacter sp. RCC_168]|uniref:hypothetical protein n=1 Tax=Mucilaginibacter sp. RCC_168 TaxID=3239221 RepID=UPI003524B95E